MSDSDKKIGIPPEYERLDTPPPTDVKEPCLKHGYVHDEKDFCPNTKEPGSEEKAADLLGDIQDIFYGAPYFHSPDDRKKAEGLIETALSEAYQRGKEDNRVEIQRANLHMNESLANEAELEAQLKQAKEALTKITSVMAGQTGDPSMPLYRGAWLRSYKIANEALLLLEQKREGGKIE